MSTTKKTLYIALAELMQRQRNLADSFMATSGPEQADRRLTMKADVEDELTAVMEDELRIAQL